MAKVTQTQQAKSPTFVPGRAYKWNPQDIFEITGQQFAAIYHMLIEEVNNPAGASIGRKIEAYETIMGIFKSGVEQGAIIEHDEMPPVSDLDDKVKDMFNNKSENKT